MRKQVVTLIAALVATGGLLAVPASSQPPAEHAIFQTRVVQFGRVTVGDTVEMLVSIENVGADVVTVQLGGLTNPDAFGTSGGSCPEIGELASGASCTVGLNFTPPTAGQFEGEFLAHVSSADGFDSTISVKVIGSGAGDSIRPR